VELKDIKVGERYAYGNGAEVVVGSVTPDSMGYIPVLRVDLESDVWGIGIPSRLSPIVRRYTVELRPPKAGPRYYLTNGQEGTAAQQWVSAQWVIVDGDQ
jgi:hypothetical protein